MTLLCKNCGEAIGRVSRTCSSCGTWNAPDSTEAQGQPGVQETNASTPVIFEAKGYLPEMKRLATSIPFIAGCLLITIGTITDTLLDFSGLSILGLAFALVHIIGLWLLVLESAFSPTSYTKTLTAFSMFRVSAILSLILLCIVFGITGIAFLFATLSGIGFLFIFALLGGLGFLIIKFYFLALLKVLDGLRERVTSNKYVPLEGLGSFLILSYISIGISVISAVVSVLLWILNAPAQFADSASVTVDMHGNTIGLIPVPPISGVAEVGPFSWAFLFVIANAVGMLLCLRVLKRFE